MTLRFAINTEPPQPEPVWYAEMRERERAFNALHPRCPGCGRFIKRNRLGCLDCSDEDWWG